MAMSIFISTLAFHSESLQIDAKSGIFLASLFADIIGYFILRAGSNSKEATIP